MPFNKISCKPCFNLPCIAAPKPAQNVEPTPKCRTKPIFNQNFHPKQKRLKSLISSAFYIWCPGSDSNRHTFRRGILSPLRLPISPPGQWIWLTKAVHYRRIKFLVNNLSHIYFDFNVKPKSYKCFLLAEKVRCTMSQAFLSGMSSNNRLNNCSASGAIVSSCTFSSG